MNMRTTDSSRRLAISDLDGTLLQSDGRFNAADLTALAQLWKLGIPRVIATGRSYFSAGRVLDRDFPIDYLVFSAGAGVMDWQRQELLLKRGIPAPLTARAIVLLQELQLDFMVHAPIPDNHRFHWSAAGGGSPDFQRRLDLYTGFTEPLTTTAPGESCQLIAIAPDNPPPAVWQRLREELAPLEIVRATSPLDDRSVWVEVYPAGSTKATACAWLADRLGVPHRNTLALGNDYNDLDLLRWAGSSYVVNHAPPVLKEEFAVIGDGSAGAWQAAVAKWLGKKTGDRR